MRCFVVASVLGILLISCAGRQNHDCPVCRCWCRDDGGELQKGQRVPPYKKTGGCPDCTCICGEGPTSPLIRESPWPSPKVSGGEKLPNLDGKRPDIATDNPY